MEDFAKKPGTVFRKMQNDFWLVKLKEKSYCTLQEAEEDLSQKLTDAVNSNRCGINIIKAQTAIGKTHKYIDIIKNSNKKFIVAVPTN